MRSDGVLYLLQLSWELIRESNLNLESKLNIDLNVMWNPFLSAC